MSRLAALMAEAVQQESLLVAFRDALTAAFSITPVVTPPAPWNLPLNWVAPVKAVGPKFSDTDWAHQLLPQYCHLRELVEPTLHDPIAVDDWKATLERFDAQPEPETVFAANARWQELLRATTSLLARYGARQAHAARAAARGQ